MVHIRKMGVRIGLAIYRAVVAFLLVVTRPIFHWLYEDKRNKKLPPITNPLILKSAVELARMIRNKEVSCTEVVDAFIDRIKEVDNLLNALVVNRFNEAKRDAAEVDRILAAGTLKEEYSEKNKPFLGVPFTAKEAFGIKGFPNTSGLMTSKNKEAQVDADVITKLRQAGAIPLGLTNCSELCMWYESSNLLYGRTNNAYHMGRMVGGSSGGEACIQSYGGSPIGVGSDIGGSIRMPAFFNGIYGHKPTTGIVSNEGQYPCAKGQAQTFLSTGPLCKRFEDLTSLFKVMAGPDDVAKLKLDQKVDLKKVKFYYVLDDQNLMARPVDGQIKNSILKVVHHLETEVGATVKHAFLDKMKLSFFLWSAKMATGGNDPFSHWMGGTTGSPVNPFKELLYWMVGRPRHTLPAIGLGIGEKLMDDPATNERLVKLCDKLKEEILELLGDDGVLLYPTHPVPAPYHNQAIILMANFCYTGIFNVLGLPVTNIPTGICKEGVPIGFQIVSSPLNDHLTIAVAGELDKVFGGWIPPCEVHC